MQYPKPLQRARSPPPALSMEQNGHDGQGDHGGNAAKRRRLQGSVVGRGGPGMEDYILPKRSANGHSDWVRREPGSGAYRRSMSPIENIGSSEQSLHHSGSPHHPGPSPYPQPPSRSQDPHGYMRDHPPPHLGQHRYMLNVHHGNGQYHSTPSMSMSRYPMHPPPPPPRVQPPPPHPSQHPSQPPQHPQQQHPHPHAQQAHPHSQSQHHMHQQSPHAYVHSSHSPRDMDDSMHPSSQYASGWNQRLPGYATVSSSSSNTRLSSTGIVHSTGPPPNSPPMYPRYSQGGPQQPYHHQQYHAQGAPPAGNEYHPSEPSQSQAPPPPPSQGGHHYSSGSSPTQGVAQPINGYPAPYHHDGHMDRERERANGGSNVTGGPAHLPPISLPHPAHPGHHQSLPRPNDLLHQQEQGPPPPSHHHQFGQHRRQPSSPMSGVVIGAPGSHPAPAAAASGISTSTDVLQQTRQDLQREVSHLSMLLGRAAAVLNGLDQVLDPHHAGASGSPPVPHSIRESGSPVGHGYAPPPHGHSHSHAPPPPQPGAPLTNDVKTNSALASLMALSGSGGPGRSNATARLDEREMQHLQQQQQPPMPLYSKQQPPPPSSSQQPPPPPHHGSAPPPPRYTQALSYPLPRRS
ncbi:hypothetical protein BC939DRAFT_459122 [Gamsiella multidivaricata]|uniref:uncharacterized protein n=1 Tax=Gamsiella multidivaricata TaxID=101098 RepID=UPI00221FCD2F|nr:uncharacterized protein BC939DRAFT_459122 [Gamsiella multidivaricata]KAI7819965.1 hypothetical protein BC939DRAFT_459122 [Gamsiella multidivaricata]